MEKHPRTRSRPGSFTARRSRAQSSGVGQIAPYVYVAIVGVGLWYVVSAWAGFVAEDDIAYLLAVVSGLFFIAIAIPCALWLAWRTGRDPHVPGQHVRFRDWASGNFRTWQGDLAGQVVCTLADRAPWGVTHVTRHS